ncbi:dihydrodipicolinate synthase family protein [Nocardia wallacei]|uniref:dihydrodipicolinate synthase family protein n=1 Tax=Nocardia wallacei TaxID=480035 RepID=UPI002453A959|nr:dihydrodipicolinate synthase family protein [Nocardia wallacei]
MTMSPIVALATPFRSDGSIDYAPLGEYLALLDHAGVTSVLVNGTTGEFASLTIQERRQITEFCRSAWPHRLIVHVGATAELLAYTPVRIRNSDGAELTTCVAQWAEDTQQTVLEVVADSRWGIKVVKSIGTHSMTAAGLTATPVLPVAQGNQPECFALTAVVNCWASWRGMSTIPTRFASPGVQAAETQGLMRSTTGLLVVFRCCEVDDHVLDAHPCGVGAGFELLVGILREADGHRDQDAFRSLCCRWQFDLRCVGIKGQVVE